MGAPHATRSPNTPLDTCRLRSKVKPQFILDAAMPWTPTPQHHNVKPQTIQPHIHAATDRYKPQVIRPSTQQGAHTAVLGLTLGQSQHKQQAASLHPSRSAAYSSTSCALQGLLMLEDTQLHTNSRPAFSANMYDSTSSCTCSECAHAHHHQATDS